MQRFGICAVAALCLLLLATASQAKLTAEEKEAIREKTEPIIENMLDAQRAGDFKRMGRDFSLAMKTALPAHKLKQTYEQQIEPEFGSYVSKTFHEIRTEKGYIKVYYDCEYTKQKASFLATFKEGDEKYRVQGIWITYADPDQAKALRFEEQAQPICENYLDALRARDYERAARDFSPDMKGAFGPDRIRESYEEELIPEFGPLVSWEFDRTEFSGGFGFLFYKTAFDHGDSWEYKFVFRHADPVAIEGLWRNPVPREVKDDSMDSRYAPVLANFYAGLRAGDFKRMTRDFSPEMKEALPAGKLKQTYETEILPAAGSFESYAHDRTEAAGEFVFVYCLARFANGAVWEDKFVFRKDDPAAAIAGLWTHPAEAGGEN